MTTATLWNQTSGLCQSRLSQVYNWHNCQMDCWRTTASPKIWNLETLCTQPWQRSNRPDKILHLVSFHGFQSLCVPPQGLLVSLQLFLGLLQPRQFSLVLLFPPPQCLSVLLQLQVLPPSLLLLLLQPLRPLRQTFFLQLPFLFFLLLFVLIRGLLFL